jgi:hypothetical protein
MFFADLVRHLASASDQRSNATIVNEQVFYNILGEICRALLEIPKESTFIFR